MKYLAEYDGMRGIGSKIGGSMQYSLSRILHNLVRNGLLYLFILISFMLGAGLFIICMNFRMTGEQLLEEAKIQSSEGLIQVLGSFHYTANPLIDPEAYQQEKTDYLITYDTYLNLISNPQYTDELEFLFALNTAVNIFIWELYGKQMREPIRMSIL